MLRKALYLLLTVVTIFGCKNSEKEEPKAPQATQPPPPKAPKKEPPPAPPDAAPAPSPAQTLAETPLQLFSASDGKNAQCEWKIAGESVVFSTEATRADGAPTRYAVKVLAAISGDEAEEVFSCESLIANSQGRVEALLRGDKVHILCINPPAGKDKGNTQAIRFEYAKDQRGLEQSGSYSGVGVVDPDTIDLDEH
jgi:hypothetical protein